jgi:adenine-specific DNA-methyltransferase
MNMEVSGNRKFILAQLPELCDESSEAFKSGFKTIADISKERVRRVIQKIKKEKSEKQDLFENENLDLGFKVFKLSASNFKIWRGITIKNQSEKVGIAAEPEENYNGDKDQENDLIEQLEMFTNPVKEGSEKENMLYELLLKAGYALAEKIEKHPFFYSVKDNELIVALETMSPEVVDVITKSLPKPKKVVTLDILFANNDQLKTNTVLQMKDAGIDFKTI